jgi:hypothetical protein
MRRYYMVEVKRVENNRMMKDFIMLPWTANLYRNDLVWVPPIISDQKKLFDKRKSYFFEIGEAEFFLAYKSGAPVGRITSHVNHLYEKKYDMDTGFFGFYESIDDDTVARSLFDAASHWLKQKDKKVMNGPQSFSIYDSVGFEVEGMDKMPTVGLFHFAPYYKDLAEASGFTKCIDWHCFLVERIHYDKHAPFLEEVKNSLLKNTDVEFKMLDKKNIAKRVKDLQQIFNEAWEGNWGHLPLTNKQMKTIFKELRMFIIPDLAIFAEKNGKTVGFIISVPDVNPGLRNLNGRLYPWRVLKFMREIKKVKRVRTIIMGVLPEYRGQHIDDIFYLKSIEAGLRLDIWETDCSMIVETNKKMLNAMKPFTPNPYKTYRIYQRPIT